MALIVLTITGVGVLMATLGWAIPRLRATPTLQPDSERPLGRDVRDLHGCIIDLATGLLHDYNVIYRRSLE